MKDDDISRQAAIELAMQYCPDDDGSCSKADRDIRELLDDLENLPSAQQERKRGKWIYNSPVTMKCERCGFVIKDWDWNRFKFCPNCTCDMRGEQDENR